MAQVFVSSVLSRFFSSGRAKKFSGGGAKSYFLEGKYIASGAKTAILGRAKSMFRVPKRLAPTPAR
jgi:hypothetical protein